MDKSPRFSSSISFVSSFFFPPFDFPFLADFSDFSDFPILIFQNIQKQTSNLENHDCK